MNAPSLAHPIREEVITSATEPRAQPQSIAAGVAVAKAAVPQRAFIFDFLRTTSHIERSYLRVGYSTQFNPQLSLIPSAEAELDPKDCLGAEEECEENEDDEEEVEGDDEEDEADGSRNRESEKEEERRVRDKTQQLREARPAVSGVAAPAPYDASTFRHRALFSMSPAERPPGVSRSVVSGRELTELEALARKHAEEMQMLIAPIVEALRGVMNNHDVVAQSITKDDRFDCFNTVAAVATSLQEYVARLSEWCYVSPSTFILACIFLDRLLFRYPRLLFSRQNIYKYFGVALRIANKCVDVKNISNKNYAHVIGVSNIHLNDLEAKLLMDIRFGLYVSPAEFFWYVRRLVPYHPAVQRLLSRTGPTFEMVNAALDLANKQTTCRVWKPVEVEPPAVVAAHATQRRLTALHTRNAMAMLAASGGALSSGGGGGQLSSSPSLAGGAPQSVAANPNSSGSIPSAPYLPSTALTSATSISASFGANNSKAASFANSSLPHQQQTATFDPSSTPHPLNVPPPADLESFEAPEPQ